MAKSSRRRKQDRAKTEAKRAEQTRRRARAEQDRRQSENFRLLLDPQTRPDEVARVVMAEMADTLAAGAIARMRGDMGVPAGELAEAARLLLMGAPQTPDLGVLAFAASAAHAAGDEDGEHRHTAELLARAEAEDDVALWLEVIRSIALTGHPGEALELIGPHLRDDPDDELATSIYAIAVQRAQEAADPGELERAALDRFADRSGLVALRDAIGGYLDRTKWGDIVKGRVEKELSVVAGEDWPTAEREVFATLAFESAVNGAADSDADADADGDEDLRELIERDRREGPAETALTAFGADPSVSPALASMATVWATHAHCGLWQLADPVARPGVWCTDLVSGTRRYAEFPDAVLDGAPPWTVWLGSIGPVDGIWRSTGTGVRLTPAEGDAAAEYVERAVRVIAGLIVGVPRDELLAPEPMRFGRAEPYGVRWDYEEPPGAEYARLASKVTETLVTALAAQVARHRATPRAAVASATPRAAVAGAAPPTAGRENAWLDERVPALGGRTPRQAAGGDMEDLIRLESLLRQLEYQAGLAAAQGEAGEKGIDVPWLRAELDIPGN